MLTEVTVIGKHGSIEVKVPVEENGKELMAATRCASVSLSVQVILMAILWWLQRSHLLLIASWR